MKQERLRSLSFKTKATLGGFVVKVKERKDARKQEEENYDEYSKAVETFEHDYTPATTSQNLDYYYKYNNRLKHINDPKKYIDRLYVVCEGVVTYRRNAQIVFLPKYDLPQYLPKFLNLRKLTLCSLVIESLNISALHRLRYLKLVNLGLKHLVSPLHCLEYANLSNNKLKFAIINSKVLILRHNKIQKHASTTFSHFLDISFNPLATLRADSKVLYIANTKISHPVISNATKIVADRTKKIMFGSCPNLKYLSVNFCSLKKLPSGVSGVNILKARCNSFEDIPQFSNLSYGDFYGNFMTYLKLSPSLEAVNLAKNGLSYVFLTNCTRLRGLDISFNPLEYIDLSESRLLLRSNSKLSIQYAKKLSTRGHSCRKESRYIRKYTLRGILHGQVVSIIFTIRTSCTKIPDFYATWYKSSKALTIVGFLEVYTRSLLYFLKTNDSASDILAVLITQKSVLIKSCGLPAVALNYAECKRVDDALDVVTWVNFGKWIIIPLLCHLSFGSEERSYKLNRKLKDFRDVFEFLGFYCPKSASHILKNDPCYLKPVNSLQITTSENTAYSYGNLGFSAEFFRRILPDLDTFGWSKDVDFLGSTNIDFSMDFYKSINDSSITTSMPVFAFLKILYTSRRYAVIQAETLNILNIIDTYCRVFAGTCIEKNYLFYVVVFKNALSASLWGLRVKATLDTVGISVGVGITGDTIFRTQNEGYLKFCGPAFNKSSRIADQGIGVFCSSFLSVSHPLVECIDEGECLFKGFTNKERIISLHMRKSESNW